MAWTDFLRRMGLEIALFFLSCSIVFYFISGRDSVIASIFMGGIATIFYAGVTYYLRRRATRGQDER
jgi:hypothetical protein